MAGLSEDEFDTTAVEDIAAGRDARLGWFLADLLRFVQRGPKQQQLLAAFEAVTGVDPSADPAFARARGTSSPTTSSPGTSRPRRTTANARRSLFTLVEPGWEPFFADADAGIDWRLVSWGGVLIDDRPLG